MHTYRGKLFLVPEFTTMRCEIQLFLASVILTSVFLITVSAEESCQGSSCQPSCICVPRSKCQENLVIFARMLESSPLCKSAGFVCCPPGQIVPPTTDHNEPSVETHPAKASSNKNNPVRGSKPGDSNDILVPDTSLSGCGRRNLRPMLRILGDTPTEFGEFPWHVAILRKNYSYVCGGALIHKHWVLTAAHCVLGIAKKDLLVRVGEHNANDPQEPGYEEAAVARVVYHPEYNEVTLSNDIAMIMLFPDVILNNYISTVCLPPAIEFLGKTCTVTGWGRNREGGSFSPVLKKVRVPIVENKQCEAQLRKSKELGPFFNLEFNFLCAGERNKDSCKGDGGSPLVCDIAGEYFVVGLVSWGIGCGGDYPGVYVRVSQYNNWIQKQLKRWP